MRSGLGRLAWIPLLMLAGAPALAHKLKVFAFADGREIQGSAYFSAGGGAGGAKVRIYDGQGRLLAEPTPGPDGGFLYRALTPEDHLVVAETGDGHRAEWRLSAAELAGGFPGTPAPRTVPAAATPVPAPGGAPESGPEIGAPPGVDPALAAAIERAVARQVRPLREALLAAEDRASLRDILGGIGYILGTAGILLWWRTRRDCAGPCTTRKPSDSPPRPEAPEARPRPDRSP